MLDRTIVPAWQLIGLCVIGYNVIAFPLPDCQSSYINVLLHTELRSQLDKTRIKNVVKLFLPSDTNMTMKASVAIVEHRSNGILEQLIGFNECKKGPDILDKIDNLLLHNDSILEDIESVVSYSKNYFQKNIIKPLNKIKLVIVITRKLNIYESYITRVETFLLHVIFLNKSPLWKRGFNHYSDKDDFSSNMFLSVGLCGKCWPGWFMINTSEINSCYKLHKSDMMLNYQSASNQCSRLDSTLLNLETKQEFQLLKQELHKIFVQNYGRWSSIVILTGLCVDDSNRISKSLWFALGVNNSFPHNSYQGQKHCVGLQMDSKRSKEKEEFEVSVINVNEIIKVTQFYVCEVDITLTSNKKNIKRSIEGKDRRGTLPWDLRSNRHLLTDKEFKNVEVFNCINNWQALLPTLEFTGIPYTFVCDGYMDCKDNLDEKRCVNMINDCANELPCTPNMWINKRRGTCAVTSEICNRVQDCLDNSDENFCKSCFETVTTEGSSLPTWWFTNSTKDKDSVFQRRAQLPPQEVVFTSCKDNKCLFRNDSSKHVTICKTDEATKSVLKPYHWHGGKFAPSCFMIHGQKKERERGCMNFARLKEDCRHIQCGPGFYRCSIHPVCIPNSILMDGAIDCPLGEDEFNPQHIYFQCRKSAKHDDLLYSQHNLCDGKLDCLLGDDEALCHENCPSGFFCLWGVTKIIDYRQVNYTNLFTTLDLNIKVFRASGLDLLPAYVPRYIRMNKLLELYLSNCNLDNAKLNEIVFAMSNSLYNVYHLDLSYNKITSYNSDFLLFRSLRILNMSHTSISTMHLQISKLIFLENLDVSYTLLSFLKFDTKSRFSMSYLNLSSTFINRLDWCEVYLSIDTIDLRNSKILFNMRTSEILQKMTSSIAIYGDSYKLCCDKFKGPGIPSHSCKAPKDAISSCENLLGDVVKRILIWMVAMAGLSGNAVVIGYRIFYEKHLLKQGYRMFVTHLGLSDFIMSVYLMIIAGADVYYRDDYVLYDNEWRDSSLCKAAGFLATLSAETSTLFVLMITLDRYLIFKDTLNQTNLTPKTLTTFVSLIWAIGIVISTIPVLFPDWQIYSSNAMCLGLPVNLTHPLGWMFSLLLYIVINFIIIVLIVLGQIVIFKHITMSSSSLISSSVHKRREIKVAKNLSFVVISNILCWFPIGVVGLMSASGHVFSPDVYGWLAVVVLPLNSAVNPILYTLPVAYKALSSMGKKST